MKLNFTVEEIELLGDLVFLGNWIINSHRLHDVQIEKYEKISDIVEKIHNQLLSSDDKNIYIDMSDFYMKRLKNYIEDYDEEGCFFTLAEKLAEANYPVNPNSTKYYDSVNMQTDAQHIYEKELNKKGVSIISVDIPDMDDQLEIYRLERGKANLGNR